jgi:uncharacterized short protein YbdD (DUF466 family)
MRNFAGTMAGIRDAARASWRFVRALSKDDAYERYLAHHGAAHPDTEPLSQRDFYLREQQRKWSGVSRCC